MKKKQEVLFVLEWSGSQQAFHIQALETALESNRRRWKSKPNESFDWVPLFIGSYRECELVARHNELRLRNRSRFEEVRWTH